MNTNAFHASKKLEMNYKSFNKTFLPNIVQGIWKSKESQNFTSHRRCSMKKGVKNLTNFTGKYQCWSLLLMKLQAFWPATLL